MRRQHRLALVVAAHLAASHFRRTEGFLSPPSSMPSVHCRRSCRAGLIDSKRKGAVRFATELMLKVERYPNPLDEERDKKKEQNDNIATDDDVADLPFVYPNNNVTRPSASLAPEDVVPLLMNALKHNNAPRKDAGLRLVWEFATDTTRWVFDNNITEFIESCHDTAEEFPTSFYGAAMDGQSWAIESPINRVGGEDGWIATQVTRTISSDGRLRRWQWELRKNRRPPDLGCWRVESIGSSDRNGDFEARDRGTGWSD